MKTGYKAGLKTAERENKSETNEGGIESWTRSYGPHAGTPLPLQVLVPMLLYQR